MFQDRVSTAENKLPTIVEAEELPAQEESHSGSTQEESHLESTQEESHSGSTQEVSDQNQEELKRKTDVSFQRKRSSEQIQGNDESEPEIEKKRLIESEYEEKRHTRTYSKALDTMPPGERTVSRTVVGLIKQRKSLAAGEVALQPNIATISEQSIIESVLETFSELSHDVLPPTPTRYSKAIEGLVRQRAQSHIIRTEEKEEEDGSNSESKKKLIKFVDLPQESGLFISELEPTFKPYPKPCRKFLKVEQFSELFVNDIIHEAVGKTDSIRRGSAAVVYDGHEYLSDSKSSSTPTSETYIYTFEWPTIENFTQQMGITKISEYLSSWTLKENWKCCVNFLKGESDETSDFYRYEAIFSIPSKQYPICQATASIYFTIEASRVRPKQCLVDVYYSFEGKRLVHTPGQYKLQETWLFHIIDAKINFYKTLQF